MEKLLEQLVEWSERATCPRAQCAAVAITDEDSPSHVFGFNRHLGEQECVIENNHCVSSVHAEVDMVANAARNGTFLDGATVISLERPCNSCLKTMRAAGIKDVMYIRDYHSSVHAEEFCSPTLMKELDVRQYKV